MPHHGTRTAPTNTPPVPTTGAPAHPRLGSVIRRVSLSLLIACVVPATLFYVCFVVAGVWTAIVVALGWSYGAIGWRALTRRRTSGLLILTAILMTGRTVIALVTDSPFLYFLQPIISDGVVATTFLLSLATARPMVARLAGDFYPMDHELSVRPRVQRLFWRADRVLGRPLSRQVADDPVAAADPDPRDVRPGQERRRARDQRLGRRGDGRRRGARGPPGGLLARPRPAPQPVPVRV